MIEPLASLGAYFSFPGAFAHERKTRQRDTFRRVPTDRLLIETDAPDQGLPEDRVTHPLGQAVNHPANIAAVNEAAAEALDQAPDDLARRELPALRLDVENDVVSDCVLSETCAAVLPIFLIHQRRLPLATSADPSAVG